MINTRLITLIRKEFIQIARDPRTLVIALLPAIMLSGYLFPIEAMPKWLQWISAAIPLTYYLNIIRALLLKGVGPGAIQTDFFALIFFGVVLIGAASLRFRKRLD